MKKRIYTVNFATSCFTDHAGRFFCVFFFCTYANAYRADDLIASIQKPLIYKGKKSRSEKEENRQKYIKN